LGQQLLEGQKSLGPERMPTAALAFEAAVDVHFDVLLDGPRTAFDGGRGAAATAAEGGGDLMPGVNAVAVVLEVAPERVELLGSEVAQGALGQGFQGRLGIGVADGLQEALELGLVGAGEGAEGLGEVPAVPQPVGVGEESVAELLEALVAIAEQQVKGGAEEALGQAAEGGAELSQGGGGDAEMFVGEPEAGGAAGLVTSGAPSVMEAQMDGEVAHGPWRRRCWALSQVESTSLMRAGTGVG